MNKQEYQHLRTLSWKILIDANIRELPTDVKKIAYLFRADCSCPKETYQAAMEVSSIILGEYGYNSKLSKYLAIRILCPMIVIKELNIHSAEEMSVITKLPLDISVQRFQRYKMLLTRNAFETSELESKLLLQFKDWIDSQNINF